MKFNAEIAGKIASYFIQKLGAKVHGTGWLRHGTCPECGKDKKFGIHVYNDRTNCFSCTYHPRVIELIMKLEALSTYNEVYNFLNAFEHATYLETPQKMLEEKLGDLPEGYRLLSIGDSRLGKLARRYMKGRGFDIDELTMKGFGYCVSGKYYGRIIIPFYEAGRMVYFNARQFIDISEDKFKNPSTSEFGVGKSLLMYNADCLHLYKRTYLMESAINCNTWGDNAFGIGGKIISQYQLTKVLRAPCKEVVIALDPDAKLEAYKSGLKLVQHKKVKILQLPEKQDVNTIGRKETLRISKTTGFMDYNQMYRVFLSIPKPHLDEA